MLPGMSCAMMMGGDAAPPFTPVVYDLDSGTLSLTVPSGATAYEVWVVGGGGGGGRQGVGGGTNPSGFGAGGGGGGVRYLSGTVLSGEWGTSLSRTVGAAGINETAATANNSTAGGNSTFSGTLGGVAISMTGNGGGATNTNTGGTGGGSSGDGSNSTGNNGTAAADTDADTIIDSVGVGGDAGIVVGTGTRGKGGAGFTTPQPIGGRIRVSFT